MYTLYIVGTPIGNLEDITLRAIRTLKEVSLIAAEDTRKAGRLLAHYEIKTPLTSFFQGNERLKIPVILEALEAGDVALISEAGMPGISDPGYTLIKAALDHKIPVVPVPGPSAHTTALVASGLPSNRFLFLGFLPRKVSERESLLQEFADVQATLVLYESPHRLHAGLKALYKVLGNRPLAICRELTKLYEEVWRGDLERALAYVSSTPSRGEYTLVIGGAVTDTSRWEEAQVRAALKAQMAHGLSHSQAAREVASQSGWSRREVYALET